MFNLIYFYSDSTEEGTSSLVSSSILPTASATIGAVAIESELSEKVRKNMKFVSLLASKHNTLLFRVLRK